MRLSEPVRLRRGIGLTALIDVVFLLLVFFMLASTFLKFGTVKLDMAGGGSASIEPSKVILVHVGADKAIQVDGEAVDSESVTAAVNARVANGATDAVVVLRRGSKVEDLVFGLQAVRASDVERVRVVD